MIKWAYNKNFIIIINKIQRVEDVLWETGDRGDTWGDTIPGVPHMRHCRAIGKISEVISQIRVVAPQRVGSDCHGTLFYLVMMMVMTTMMEILSLMMILMMVLVMLMVVCLPHSYLMNTLKVVLNPPVFRLESP